MVKKSTLSLSTRDIVIMGLMLAVVESAKYALSSVPGVEVVTLLFIIYTLFLEKKIIYILPAFYIIEGALFGFGIWWFMYVYIWAILALLTYLFRKIKSVWFWSIFSGLYGLLFGLLCCPVYFATGGINMAISWWISGIPTDVIHGISNFLVCLILFKPLRRALDILERK